MPARPYETVRLWVCVDLAYGYSEPSTRSAIVWQMSQHDGWYVDFAGEVSNWIGIKHGNQVVWMRLSDFCTQRPVISVPPDVDRSLIYEGLMDMIQRNKGQ